MNESVASETSRAVVGLGMRPLRIFAPFMLAGGVLFAIAAVWLLAQSGAGVVTFAAAQPGTGITIPAAATDPLVIYAVVAPGLPTAEVRCELTTSTGAFVAMDFGGSVTSQGRVLSPVGKVTSGWRTGDTVTCAGNSVESVVLGHDSGRTYLLPGLLCGFVALGSGIMGLVGFASRRRTRP